MARPTNGRPSVDPVSMFKMLLIGYLYGIKSERRLVEDINLNIAYRWFCGFEFGDRIPDHSTFSKTRVRKWNESKLFQQAFYEIVRQCIVAGLVDGKELVADGSYIPVRVSKSSWVEVEYDVEVSMQSYLDALDEELANQPGFKKPPVHIEKKKRLTSSTDPDCGGINHGNKRGIGYLLEATVDCKNGIVTGVDVYPANQKESLIILHHLLTYYRLTCNKSTGKYLRCYQVQDDSCVYCSRKESCFDKTGIHRRILGSSCYPAFHRSHMRVGTPQYWRMMKQRKIWAEGCFSVLKRKHCLSAIRKRGLLAATEECRLSAMALT